MKRRLDRAHCKMNNASQRRCLRIAPYCELTPGELRSAHPRLTRSLEPRSMQRILQHNSGPQSSWLHPERGALQEIRVGRNAGPQSAMTNSALPGSGNTTITGLPPASGKRAGASTEMRWTMVALIAAGKLQY
jgi:hypothetical protein